ncbi:MAG TPA: protein kinase, partial [Terracidiphilus sp.]|nr:protein kinase [Terracidiphilus sp.]
MKDTLPTRIRFGSFELDLKSGELREGDHRTPLQVQPFKVLLILLEHNGEIVTREEIKKQLWPNDTIVEFDHSINVAVGTLRRALGDSAEEPKYIETLARRGYRLMVPVEWPEAAGDNLPEMPTSLRPESWIGRKVSHYRVLEIIGGGGMGLVYKAEDLKLGRRVALKFLPEELAGDPVALQRFEREAQTASSLNHPNICTIHEVEEQEGQPFIVMELLEGETLRDRLATAASGTRTVSLDELLQIAIQVCDGLEAAHQKSIIHRDIKPANIFLTISGQVKILDFGLAKLVVGAPGDRQLGPATGDGVEAPDFSPANTDENERGLQPRPELKPVAEEEPGRRAEARRFYQPAADSHLTRTGAAMGTAGYMSPEQVRGEKLDARTDLFSFGLVLYEMATGQRAFAGETAAIVHDAIQNKAPVPVRELNSSLPAKLVTTIDRALEKKRETRYQNAAEMGRDLRGLQQRSSTRVRSARFILTGLAASILSGIGFLLFRTESQKRKPAGQSVVRQLTPTSVESPLLGALALSPNGKQLMYLDRKKGLCLLQVDSGENRSFANTTTFAPINWLPDGEHILVSKATDSGIWNMSVLDGTTRKFRDDGLLPYPSPDGHHIAFLSSGGENAEIWLMEA